MLPYQKQLLTCMLIVRCYLVMFGGGRAGSLQGAVLRVQQMPTIWQCLAQPYHPVGDQTAPPAVCAC
jgi:hypothetical protein